MKHDIIIPTSLTPVYRDSFVPGHRRASVRVTSSFTQRISGCARKVRLSAVKKLGPSKKLDD